ncbi:hypothetical protein QBC38DRAFT_16827 [Podospora fimiseda]|uniref:Uncharacterized protein n=1 Tax=Podospora fimiseda TaxID=252190 RepID=A0AAN7BJJ5_9PEZI|nr:hypothetical protein QBC38DRAFT_16827 [Podospora fimiseda]
MGVILLSVILPLFFAAKCQLGEASARCDVKHSYAEEMCELMHHPNNILTEGNKRLTKNDINKELMAMINGCCQIGAAALCNYTPAALMCQIAHGDFHELRSP